MNVYKFNISKNIKDNFFSKNKTILLLGKFETFHIGHNLLLEKAKEIQLSNKEKIGIFIIVKENDNNEIQSLENRLTNLAKLGFDFCIVTYFDSDFKNIEGNQFIKYINNNFNVSNYITGSDFKFGKNRKFSANDISNFSNSNIHIINLVEKFGLKVSSSKIKQMHEFGEYNLIKELTINPLIFDVKVINNSLEWNSKTTVPHYGIYYFMILIENYWYHGIIKFSISEKIDFYLINKDDYLINHETKIKILDICRIITNQRYDFITDDDKQNAKLYFSNKK